jgi:hypothetical protein
MLMSSAASLAGRTRWATTVSSTGGLPNIDNGVLGVTMMPLEAATLVGTLTPRGDMYKSRDWENSGPRLQCLGTSDLPSGVGARELADPADCAREMGDAAEFDGDACIIGARVSVEMLLIAIALECLMPCMSLDYSLSWIYKEFGRHLTRKSDSVFTLNSRVINFFYLGKFTRHGGYREDRQQTERAAPSTQGTPWAR